ncbi:unnamed protein product [marine sediment metagenome]|uniref:Uncharacterized protein n=1 Tax=marine sediment metagenome TaxID=412755 RepID=X0VMM7_9ZZZZ
MSEKYKHKERFPELKKWVDLDTKNRIDKRTQQIILHIEDNCTVSQWHDIYDYLKERLGKEKEEK